MIIEYLAMSGPFVFPLLLLLLLIATLAVRNALRLRSAEPSAAGRWRGSVDAILFWGGVAAVLGVLGQCTGLYRAIRAVAAQGLAPECAADPARCYAIALAESSLTTITGLTIFLIAGLLWFVLRRKMETSSLPAELRTGI